MSRFSFSVHDSDVRQDTGGGQQLAAATRGEEDFFENIEEFVNSAQENDLSCSSDEVAENSIVFDSDPWE
jgi:hypothetical protein